MTRRTPRWMPGRLQGFLGGGLLASQLLLAVLVPLADARLESEAAFWIHGSGQGAEVHADHPRHDHHLCDLCRAISIFALDVPESDHLHPGAVASMRVSAAAASDRPGRISFIPLGSRAPPAG